jgi:cysteine desulfurase
MNIYLDNAASTPIDPEVLEQMMPFLAGHAGNPSSTHQHGRHLRGAIEQSRRTIAQCLGASPAEICFTSGGTEADNLAIQGAVSAYGIQHIISTRIEHHAVTHVLEQLEARGKVKVTWLQVDATGNIRHDDLRSALQTNPRSLVSLMHANNEIGTLHDIAAIGEICAAYDALFHSDTVQSMGHIPFDLQSLHLHFATASAHKFYGPRGIGFLYVRQGVRIPALFQGGGQERNLRPGTENVAGCVGMAFALQKCYGQLDTKNLHLWDLKQYMQERLLQEFPGTEFNGETARGMSLPTVLNTALPSQEEDPMLLFHLDLMGVSVSGGSACNSGANQGSHVLQGIGCSPERINRSVRFSFGLQNTRAEIDTTLDLLAEIISAPVV